MISDDLQQALNTFRGQQGQLLCGADVAACLLDPSFSYLEECHELVLTAVHELAQDAFSEYPNLSIVVQDQVSHGHVRMCRAPQV